MIYLAKFSVHKEFQYHFAKLTSWKAKLYLRLPSIPTGFECFTRSETEKIASREEKIMH